MRHGAGEEVEVDPRRCGADEEEEEDPRGCRADEEVGVDPQACGRIMVFGGCWRRWMIDEGL